MGSPRSDRILNLHGERMVTRNFEPGGRSWSQLKDINNALNLAQENRLNLLLAQCVETAYHSLVNDYKGGELDHSVYYLWLEHTRESDQG